MTRRRRGIGIALTAATVLGLAAMANAVSLDESGELTLGIRAYTAARIGVQDTSISIISRDNPAVSGGVQQTYRSLTFPVSAAGHLRQNRYFLEAEARHDLDRLIREDWRPFGLLNHLPFKLRNVKYNLTYRGEYEGVYDYGPSEYRTAHQWFNQRLVLPFNGQTINVVSERQTLRNVAVLRNRLFQAFIEGEAGPIFFRFGRQILAWGETDVFRLMDNINPLDNSFGGFLIPLDERRVPIDMLRMSYHVPNFFKLPFSEMFLEGFVAIDNAVAINPGIPNGSPWQLPNLQPSATTFNQKNIPPANFAHTRGGGQFKFNTPLPFVEEGTFSIAHYYTYVDTPVVQTYVNRLFPLGFQVGESTRSFLAVALQKVPTVQITGASGTFSVPSQYARYIGLSGEPIVRTELAYFHNEPRFTQTELDPFIYFNHPNGCHPVNSGISTTPLCTGGGHTGDSWNYVLGLDLNQFIRAINPNQSFFFSTQFFYKHLNGAAKRRPVQTFGNYLPGQPHTYEGEVLPVPGYLISPDNQGLPNNQASEPGFVHTAVDQYLQTLLIGTQYYSGQVIPALTVAYDWSGSGFVTPQVTFSRDPFRFTVAYSYLGANKLKGNSGISLLHDRDNFLFQFEYVL